ncbi:MAG: hypothetical protein WJU30_00092 [Candidatus Phytoplasma pruni]
METNKKIKKLLFNFFCFIVLSIVISAIISKIIFLQNTESDFKKVDNSVDKLHYNLEDTKAEFKQNFDKLHSNLDRCIKEIKANKQDSKPDEVNKENQQDSQPDEANKKN